MRVLLDENLPLDLAKSLPGHEVTTVHALGWDGIKNGDLLDRAAGSTDAFVTMDANLEFQQRLQGRPFGVVVIHAKSNRLADLLPLPHRTTRGNLTQERSELADPVQLPGESGLFGTQISLGRALADQLGT